jgi:hypothetical protein
MPLSLYEFFGFAPEDHSQSAEDYRARRACPFVGGSCIKRHKSGLINGACTLKQSLGDPVICCPNRMYGDSYRILLEVAHASFGERACLCRTQAEMKGDGNDVQVFGKRWRKELRLPGRGVGGGYFVDWVLALVDSERKLKEFVAVELQTMDTTGSYERQVRLLFGMDVSGYPPKDSNINWENVSKRILPQIIYKGHVLRREPLCTKGLFFICPTPVKEHILTRLGGKLEQYHPQAGAVTFRWYDPVRERIEGSLRPLVCGGQLTTTIDQVALAFTSPSNLPPPRVYEQAIRAELGE